MTIEYHLSRDPCAHTFVGLEFSTDLVEWDAQPKGVTVLTDLPDQTTLRLTVPDTNRRAFVRLRVEVP